MVWNNTITKVWLPALPSIWATLLYKSICNSYQLILSVETKLGPNMSEVVLRAQQVFPTIEVTRKFQMLPSCEQSSRVRPVEHLERWLICRVSNTKKIGRMCHLHDWVGQLPRRIIIGHREALFLVEEVFGSKCTESVNLSIWSAPST